MGVETILVCVLSSTLAAAVVTSLKDIFISRIKRKDDLADRKEEKKDREENNREDIVRLEEHIKNTDKKLEELTSCVKQYIEDHNELSKGIIRSNKLIMQGKIEYLGKKFIAEGHISFEHRKMLHEMWHEYHYTWGGNGDLNLIMEAVDELPLDKEEY